MAVQSGVKVDKKRYECHRFSKTSYNTISYKYLITNISNNLKV